MQGPLEVEKKYRVTNTDTIKTFLQNLPFEKEKRVVDHYFDTKDGLFYQHGIFIRVRNDLSLDIKFNPEHLKEDASNTRGDHVVCHEYNIPLPFSTVSEQTFEAINKAFAGHIFLTKPNPFTFEAFLEENNLSTLVLLDKKRTTYRTDTLEIALDEFKDFGTFIEFESKQTHTTMDAFYHDVSLLTEDLNIEPFDSGYVELALLQTNEALYKTGKYLIHKTSDHAKAA